MVVPRPPRPVFFGRLLGSSLEGGAVTTASCAGGALYMVCLLFPVISAIGMSEIAVKEFDCGGGAVGCCMSSLTCPDMSGLMGIESSNGRRPDLGG